MRFNELKKLLDVNNNTLENFKSEIKLKLQKLEDKTDNKIKETPSAANSSLAKQNKKT